MQVLLINGSIPSIRVRWRALYKLMLQIAKDDLMYENLIN